MSPGGFFGRLFGWIVWQLGRGLGLGELEQTWEQTYGQVDDETFQQATAQAQQAVANAERLIALPEGSPLSDALAGAPEPSPAVWVRAVMHWQNRQGGDVYRTVDFQMDWSATVEEMYAEAADIAGNMGDQYNDTLVNITVTPPLLF